MRYHDPRAGLRGGVSFMLVLLAHAALIGAALQWGMRIPMKPAALEAMMVELTLVPLAPTAPPTEVAPGPPQQEQLHLESKIEQLPQPKLELPPDLNTLTEPYTPPIQEAAAPSTPGAEQTTSPPAVNATPDTRYAASQISAGSSSKAMVTWQSVLLGHLERFKRYPRRAERLRQEGIVYVLFSVDRQGHVRNGRLGKSSGYPALDDETLAVVQRADPVPPPPPEIVGDPVEVMVPVSFYLR
jgi:protein TonB